MHTKACLHLQGEHKKEKKNNVRGDALFKMSDFPVPEQLSGTTIQERTEIWIFTMNTNVLAACLHSKSSKSYFFHTVRRESTEIAQRFLRASPAAVSNILCSSGSVNIRTFCKSRRLEDVSDVKHFQWTSSPVSFNFFYEITGCMAYRWLPAVGYIFKKYFLLFNSYFQYNIFFFYSTFYLKKSLY